MHPQRCLRHSSEYAGQYAVPALYRACVSYDDSHFGRINVSQVKQTLLGLSIAAASSEQSTNPLYPCRSHSPAVRPHPEIPERLHGVRLCLAAPQHRGRQLRWQVAQLVPHERYQGRHHQGCAPLDQRWQLVAQRLAGTCGRAAVSCLDCIACPRLKEPALLRQVLSGPNEREA